MVKKKKEELSCVVEHTAGVQSIVCWCGESSPTVEMIPETEANKSLEMVDQLLCRSFVPVPRFGEAKEGQVELT